MSPVSNADFNPLPVPAKNLTRELVLAQRDALPVFPRVVDEVLMSLDDPDANINTLVTHLQRDPVLSARVYSLAGVAASRNRHGGETAKVRDLFAALSLIGLKQLRETVITSSLAGFLRGALPPGMAPGFWEHSAAAGVSARQVAAVAHQPTDPALIAGLLHDIGQLWLFRFEPETFSEAWRAASAREQTIVAAERARFGVDHAQVGAWLAESWGLPRPVCDAILYHHAPESALDEPLVAVVHVAEVLANALDLGSGDARVAYLSAKACEKLGLTWDESAEAMFGRIDAVSQFVAHYFRTA